jgi:hypothetical protein
MLFICYDERAAAFRTPARRSFRNVQPVRSFRIDTAQKVLDGYVKAAMWRDPQATSHLALSMAAMTASGIPPGFDIRVGTLYEKDKAFHGRIERGNAPIRAICQGCAVNILRSIESPIALYPSSCG